MSNDERNMFWHSIKDTEHLMMSMSELEGASNALANVLERWDGKGEPKQLEKEEIPLTSRILRLSLDYWYYRKGHYSQKILSHEATMKIFQHQAGSIYDPNLVNAFQEQIHLWFNSDDPVVIDIRDAKAGMVLHTHIEGPGRSILLPEGKKLDAPLIQKLKQYAEKSNLRMQLIIDPASINDQN